jgi:hypothetical protein
VLELYRDLIFPPSRWAWVVHIAVVVFQLVGNAWSHRIERERDRQF